MTLVTPSAVTQQPSATPRPTFPGWGYAGLASIAVGWVTAWLPTHPLSAVSFILLWGGLIFTLDALNVYRSGTSLLRAHAAKFWQLFVFSTIFWWMFEGLNARVQNWHYLTDHPFGLSWNGLSYNIMATLCFSTVLPAVMEMAALFSTFRLFASSTIPETRAPRPWLIVELLLGIVTLALPLAFPQYFFGLIWVGPLLILDPINGFLGRRTVIGRLYARDWRFMFRLPLATLACGFFWEMWNYWSLPKWYYTVPYVGFAKIFEMPLLGYSGYLPFGLELFALYQFLLWVVRQHRDALPF